MADKWTVADKKAWLQLEPVHLADVPFPHHGKYYKVNWDEYDLALAELSEGQVKMQSEARGDFRHVVDDVDEDWDAIYNFYTGLS